MEQGSSTEEAPHPGPEDTAFLEQESVAPVPKSSRFSPGWWHINESCHPLPDDKTTGTSPLASGNYYVARPAILFKSSAPPSLGDGSVGSPFSFRQFLQLVSHAYRLDGVRFTLAAGTWSHAAMATASKAVSGSSDSDPLIVIRASGGPTAPLYIQGDFTLTTTSTSADVTYTNHTTLLGPSRDDAKGITAIRMEDCQYVQLRNLRIEAFKEGIQLFGRCRYIHLLALQISWCAIRAIFISLNETDKADFVPDTRYTLPDPAFRPEDFEDRYPACILIERSQLHDNGCGCDSGATQISIGPLATNVTVRCCEIYCTDTNRGADGITFVACSSGHVIEYNDIHHIPRLRTSDCADDCQPSDSGGISDGDGLDLKGVRHRTPLSGFSTVIRYNSIHHCEGTGITIQGSCVGILVYANEIFCNNTGVLLLSGRIQTWYESVEAAARGFEGTGFIQLYRNIIHRNHEVNGSGGNGIQLDLEEGTDSYDRSAVIPTIATLIHITHNTIDLNEGNAISAGRDPNYTCEYQYLNITSNILSRSNSREGDVEDRVFQLVISSAVLEPEVNTFTVDANLYVLFDDDFALLQADTEAKGPRNAEILRLGAHGVFSIKAAWSGMYPVETHWQGRGDSETDPLNPALSFSEVCSESGDISDYRPIADSPAIGTALATVGVRHDETASDIASSLEFYRESALDEPDVGAVESEFETPTRNHTLSGYLVAPSWPLDPRATVVGEVLLPLQPPRVALHAMPADSNPLAQLRPIVRMDS